MAELQIMRQGPLEAIAKTARPCAAATFHVAPPQTRFVLRCRSDAVSTGESGFGLIPPRTACTATTAGTRAALWLGPDEWLLLAPEEDASAIAAGVARVLGPVPHSLVDVSHRNAALIVDGPQAAVLLNHGCPLDLSDAAFPVGMCTRTLLGKTEIILWRTGERTYRVEAERSFAVYIWLYLDEARREFLLP